MPETLIHQEFPSVSPYDTSPRVGQRNPDLERPEVQAQLGFSAEQIEAGIDAFVKDRVEDFKARNPNATAEEITSVEAGNRSTANKLMRMTSAVEVDAQIDGIYADRYSEGEKHHRERLHAIEESGELATEQEVKLVTHEAEWFERERRGAEARASRSGDIPEQPPEPEQAEKFDFDEWLKLHEGAIDKDQDKDLRGTLKNIQAKLSSKWEAGRKGELPEDEKAELLRAGRAAMNIAANIIEEYFDDDFIKGLEENGYAGDRKVLRSLFEPIIYNSKFGMNNEAGRFVAEKVDIYEDPATAVNCLRHAYNEISKDRNDPRAIFYGSTALNILRALQDRLSIKVPEAKMAKFDGLIKSLQMNEREIGKFN